MNDLTDDNESLKKRCNELETENRTLVHNNTINTNEVEQCKKQILQQIAEARKLKQRSQQLEEENKQFKQEIENLKVKNQRLKQEVGSLNLAMIASSNTSGKLKY